MGETQKTPKAGTLCAVVLVAAVGGFFLKECYAGMRAAWAKDNDKVSPTTIVEDGNKIMSYKDWETTNNIIVSMQDGSLIQYFAGNEALNLERVVVTMPDGTQREIIPQSGKEFEEHLEKYLAHAAQLNTQYEKEKQAKKKQTLEDYENFRRFYHHLR